MFTLPTVNSWPGHGHQWLSSLFVNQRKKFNVASILSTTITRDLGEKPCLQVGSAAVGLLHEKGNVTAMLCDAGFEGVDERHLKNDGEKEPLGYYGKYVQIGTGVFEIFQGDTRAQYSSEGL